MADEETVETPEEPDESRRRRWPAVTAVAAAVTLIAGGLFAAQGLWGDEDPEGTPPAAGGEGETSAAELVLDDAVGAPDLGIATLVPAGELPSAPESAAVYRYQDDAVSRETAEALAAALDVEGELDERDDGSWSTPTDDPALSSLTVWPEAPGGWTYTPGEVAWESEPGGDPVDAEEALRTAEPVLTVLGLDDETARISADTVQGPVRTVEAVPLLDGLPAVGLETTLYIGPYGTLQGATGALALPEAAEERATVGARQALDAYNSDPNRPVVGYAEPQCAGVAEPVPFAEGEPAPMPPMDDELLECASATDELPATAETAAELGLVLHTSENEPVLVPSWLFEVTLPDDGTVVATWPAVDYRQAETQSGEDGGSSPADPGEGAEGDGVAPGEGGEQDLDTGMSVESYESDATSLTVTYWAGVCDEHRLVAEESEDTVRVSVEPVDPEPGRECIALAEEQTGELTLDAPIGDRTLVDPTGAELSVR
ncbi:hypothetical protein E1265_34900 [Streptomyces sp. 8K308]|uniref:hypothetical protein n=1 Tax=Streptomyces sp. 8K308 TaxID=2530388 RepID=UPI00104770CD|nr:hypothetical protein [Streptomyces sp. 8K308]TDC06257.1 hypothetical protein E1265_34900 [Streptomyces sp. 8K308]